MNKKLSRRDFIKLIGVGTVGAAAVLLTPSIFRESLSPNLENKNISSINNFLHFDALLLV